MRVDRRSLLAGSTAIAADLLTSSPSLALGRHHQDTAGAQQAAEELSVLEAQEHLPALYEFYARMHPDAQAIIPRHVVIGWFQDNWHPKGAHQAVATGVRVIDWTWGVNGATYPDTHEVSYIQEFDHSSTERDVVRLVLAGGSWRWFFGRSRAFVDAQIALYNDRAYIPQAGVVPYDLHRAVDAQPTVIPSLPIRVGDATGQVVSDAHHLPDYAMHMPPAIQYRIGEFPVGYARATTLRAEFEVAETVELIVNERVESPPFRLISWNLDPANAVPFAHYEHFASEAVGSAQTIIWGDASGSVLWEISFVSESSLQDLAQALIALAAA